MDDLEEKRSEKQAHDDQRAPEPHHVIARPDPPDEGPKLLTRDDAVKLFGRLEDAGMKAHVDWRTEYADGSTSRIPVVTIDPASIDTPGLFRYIADVVEELGVPIGGSSMRVRIG